MITEKEDWFCFNGTKIKLDDSTKKITITQLVRALHRAGLKVKVVLVPDPALKEEKDEG